MNPVFPINTSTGARQAITAVGAAIILVASRLLVPRAASVVTEAPGPFYLASGFVTLGLAAALWLLAGRPRWSSAMVLEGFVAGLAGVVLAGLVAAPLGALGGPPDASPTGSLMVLFYSASTALLTGLALYTVAIAAPVGDEYENAIIAGGVLALASIAPNLAQGSILAPSTLAVAASTLAIGSVATLLALRAGTPWPGSVFYLVVISSTLLGPFTIGGSVIVGSALLAFGSLAGYALVTALSGGVEPPPLPRPSRPGRLGLALLALLVVLAGLLAYGASQGIMVWRPYAIVTGSMEPAISRGDLVFLERVSPEEIRVGDVITFMKGNTPVTHRVVKITENGFKTKGDANSAPDPYIVRPEEVLGRVRVVVPYAGWLVILVNWNPTVRILVALASLGVLAWAVARR